jgi:RND family efflux transporter MFP subunit
MKKKYLILLVLGIFSIGGWRFLRNRGQETEVRTAVVERRNIKEELIASGEVKAETEVVLNFSGSGKLWSMNVKEGDNVVKGQILAGLDPRVLSTASQDAYFAYLAADANAKDVEDEVKGNDNDETFDIKNKRVAAQSARDRAYFAWQQAHINRANANLVSPISGIVTGVTTRVVGDTVSATDGITVVDPNSLYFEFEVDESDIGQVREGQAVSISLDAFSDEKFSGVVTSISFSSVIGETGAIVFPVKAKVSSGVGRLRPGFNGDASITLREVGNALSLPASAIDKSKVKKVGSENETDVKLGLSDDEYVEILEGLNEGDTVEF